jgi:hypothetical protein
VGVLGLRSIGLREGESKGAIDGLSTGAAVTGPSGGACTVGTLVSLLLGDAPGLEEGAPVDDPLAGDCVGLAPDMSVGLREGEKTGAIDGLSTGVAVAGPSGGTGSVGVLVPLLLDEA